MDSPVFATGRGIPVIRDAAAPGMNDATSTKQSVTAASGIVVLASNKTTQRYWHADLAATAPAPVTSFTASTTSGTAPLPVQFTNTSSGSPTSWSWDFGDGTTATVQNPAHTYTAPGTYTVTLTAGNGSGPGAPVTATVTVSPAASAVVVTAGASSSAGSTTAATDVVLPRPAGVAAGDLLIAQITVDATPTMAALPAGWTTVTPTMNVAGGAKVYVYHHLVTDPAVEPDTYRWQLSAPQKWGAGMSVFTGVDPANPFDTAATSALDTTYAATSFTVPGVTTVTDGAMLVGGVGLDNMTALVSEPAAWTEAWETTGTQVSELAHRQTGTAGATGNLTWSLSKPAAAGGWVRALRPAPRVPTASFTASAASGQAPLPVQFTDTSSGAPTSWAWDFGDGGTATEQNPAHTYTAAGTYTVRLSATNAVGTSTSVTTTVTVAATPVLPVASFAASATTGQAPLVVQFSDTSTGTPTSWAWNFGDGTTATGQNPTHTFTTAGTYTVRLTVTNAAGAGSPATVTVTVTPAPPRAGATTTASSPGGKQMVAARPAGVVNGDVLVARIVTSSSVKSVPAGWTLAQGTTGAGAVYYHRVTNAAAEPATYMWELAPPKAWSAVMTTVTGIDPRTPAAAVPYAQAVWPPA
jgi:PKD repeat protein